MCNALKGGEVDELGEQINRTIAKVWARVEVWSGSSSASSAS